MTQDAELIEFSLSMSIPAPEWLVIAFLVMATISYALAAVNHILSIRMKRP